MKIRYEHSYDPTSSPPVFRRSGEDEEAQVEGRWVSTWRDGFVLAEIPEVFAGESRLMIRTRLGETLMVLR